MNSEMKPSAIYDLLTSLKRRMARERNIRCYLDSVNKFCGFAKQKDRSRKLCSVIPE